MGLDFLLIDAFASRPFTGNPAAVVRLRQEMPDDRVLQSIAMEFNQAETAFIHERNDGQWDLRWFTPTREVPLCGHATLASAHALYHEWRQESLEEPVRFVTRESDQLICRAEGPQIVMDFPATPPAPCQSPANASAVLGITGPVICVGSTAMNLTLALPDEAQIRTAKPDLRILASWHETGVTITARSADGEFDFVSRFFAPQSGIDEDPVTGSAHCSLAVYWAEILGKTDFRARQLSPRGGELGVNLRRHRVELRGTAVTTARGELLL